MQGGVYIHVQHCVLTLPGACISYLAYVGSSSTNEKTVILWLALDLKSMIQLSLERGRREEDGPFSITLHLNPTIPPP